MSRFVLLFVALALVLSPMSSSRAMDVQPLRMTLIPSSGQTSGTLSVNNTRDRPLLFEVVVERRVIAPDGSQTFTPAEDDFIVFPPQGSVDPGRSQALRFQYVGATDLAETQGYVIRVKEVPVMAEGFSGVQFAYAFGVAIYVKPKDARDAIRVDSVTRSEAGLTIELTNTGNDYSLLTDKRFRFEVDGQRRTLDRDELGKLIGLPLVAPGAKRTLQIAIPDLPAGQVTTVSFDQRS